ncbi:sugar phosphate isomerase/epimerase family protein [Paenibacillus periandrae]|uniref:sugar phosphate isomerase/epimerase family protein n=1 Tax=Paenibacillus periandrae TaxID=1761741 RepID=UPI001F0985BE|nr:sugar phosphate isomerase/epimerase family protein [Paenibacillus periandrae]
MKLAVTIVNQASSEAPFVLRGTYTESMKAAASIGYDAVELHLAHPNEVNLEEITLASQQYGIRVSSIGTGLSYLRDGITLTHTDEKLRRDAIERVKAYVHLAKELHCVVIIGLIKGIIKNSVSPDAYRQMLDESLKECIQVAEEAGVTLVLEAVNRYESDFLNSISDCISFIDTFQTDKLKIHIDTFHMNMEEDHIAANIVQAGKRIGHVHIADSNRQYPGKGHYNFTETLEALAKIGYEGALSVECLSRPTPIDAAEGAYRFLRNLANTVV